MTTISEKNQAAGSIEFLSGDGEMARLMRGHDWSQSSLGSPEYWPQPLRTAVRLMLTTRHPMYIWWGDDGACLYNDAYRSSIGPERHPCSLGRPAREVWDEIWEIIGPQIEQVMAGGPATWHENQLVPITRNGRRPDPKVSGMGKIGVIHGFRNDREPVIRHVDQGTSRDAPAIGPS